MIKIDDQEYYTAREISNKTGIPYQSILKNKSKIEGVKKMLKEYLFIEEEVMKAFIKDA